MNDTNFEHVGFRIRIEQDTDSESSRGWDNLGVMVCFHKRYELGDKHEYSSGNYSSWEELKKAIVRDHDPAVILPLGLLDHSGLHIYAGGGSHWSDSQGWDSGNIGFAFVSKKKAREEYGKRLTKKRLARAEACLRSEIETYDQYLRGDVWWYVVETLDGEHIDSCCGFFGIEYCTQEAKSAAEYEAKRQTTADAESNQYMAV